MPGGIRACHVSNKLKRVEHPQSIPVHHGHIPACDLELSRAQNVNEDMQTHQRCPKLLLWRLFPFYLALLLLLTT